MDVQNIIDKLPEETDIIGIAPTRAIFIDGKLLNTKDEADNWGESGFNWGYDGVGCRLFSIRFLRLWLTDDEIDFIGLDSAFLIAFINRVTPFTFRCTIHLKAFVQDIYDERRCDPGYNMFNNGLANYIDMGAKEIPTNVPRLIDVVHDVKSNKLTDASERSTYKGAEDTLSQKEIEEIAKKNKSSIGANIKRT